MPQYARLCGTGTSVLVHVVSLHCHLVTRAYLFMYLPCFIAATWWRRHGFFVLAVSRSTREVHGRPCFYVRCVSALPPGGMGMPGCLPSVSQGHHLMIRGFLFVLWPCPTTGMPVCKQAMSSSAMQQLRCSTVTLHIVPQYGHAYLPIPK